EEEAFHHLHIEPPIVAHGRVPCLPGELHPSKAPLVPQNRPILPLPENTGRIDFRFPPHRRTFTLSDEFRHATKNCPSHRARRTISGMCCVKSTQSPLSSSLQ